MEIAVCVKRVPMVGGKIVVTADGQDVDTRMSGFTVSPHEECAVEEAVQPGRAARRQGYRADARPSGRRRSAARHAGARRHAGGAAGDRRPGMGPDRDRRGDRGRGHRRRAADPAASPYDLLLFGNEAADTGDYQVAVRVAHALGLPCVTGIKSLEVTDGGSPGEREYRGAEESSTSRCPRSSGQGGHQPAQVSLAPGPAAGQTGHDRNPRSHSGVPMA